VWKCIDQQCSALVKHNIKCFSCLPSSLTDVLSLNRHWSILINDHLLDAWTTVIQMSPQLVNISHRILIDPLLYHCRDSVIYVLKSGMLRSHRLGAIIEVSGISRQSCVMTACVCTVHWLTVLLNLKAVTHLGLSKKYGIHGWQEIYWSICGPKIIVQNRWSSDKAIAKIKQEAQLSQRDRAAPCLNFG